MRIYLDACCINRPFDCQESDRIRLETEAILLILSHFSRGDWSWSASEVTFEEIDRMPDENRKEKVLALMECVESETRIDAHVIERGRILMGFGLKAMDALHIASAEAGKVDVFLTTDDSLLSAAMKHSADIHVLVANPLTWLSERNKR